tara:strand:- start:1928 stop:3100 length:1173 start_codon:yes stop_codon:yes gene_type:complete
MLKTFQNVLGSELRVPNLPELNLPIWEFCHVGWFYERWISRNERRVFDRECDSAVDWNAFCAENTYFERADTLFDSSQIHHDARWNCTLPTYQQTLNYLESTSEDIVREFETKPPQTKQDFYFFKLSLAHEMMHLEAFKMTAQRLKFEIPGLKQKFFNYDSKSEKNFLPFSEQIISPFYEGYEFHFDNEIHNQAVTIKPFKIQASCVTLGDFLEFLLSDDFLDPRFWSIKGQKWLAVNFHKNSFYKDLKKKFLAFKNIKQDFVEISWFANKEKMALTLPALHISYFEAEAYAKWFGMRLPTEFEWLVASHSKSFYWGSVWEWTADSFYAFPNFVPHPYKDYSKPWFDGNHMILKGASFASCEDFRNIHFRNFYTPNRNDIFSGFRIACSL